MFLCRALAASIQVSIYVLLALWVSWQMSVLAIAIGLATVWTLAGFVRRVRQASADVDRHFRELNKRLQEVLAGIKAIKAMGREALATGLVATEVQALRVALQRRVLNREYREQLEEPILLVALLLGGLLIFSQWREVETVILLLVLFERTVKRLVGLQRDYLHVVQAEPALESVRDSLARAEHRRGHAPGGYPPSLEREIRFEQVSFDYGGIPVLDRASMRIGACGLTVLTGPSGVGKTTAADLVVGLMAPTAGQILVDDRPLESLDLAAWRAGIGYMPQDSALFHGSVVDNVTLGDPELSREDARAALDTAEAWGFVSALPQGIETGIGERGARLSGGQRQRVGLARAIVRRPALLILDEATTGLDRETEREICATLRRLSETIAVLAIGHHGVLLEHADVVYELADGRIEERIQR